MHTESPVAPSAHFPVQFHSCHRAKFINVDTRPRNMKYFPKESDRES